MITADFERGEETLRMVTAEVSLLPIKLKLIGSIVVEVSLRTIVEGSTGGSSLMGIAGRDRYRGNTGGCRRGTSLVEVSAALMVLGLVVVPAINLFRAGDQYCAAARRQLAAVSLAQTVIEEIEALPPDGLYQVGSATPTTVTLERGVWPRLTAGLSYLVVVAGEEKGGIAKLLSYEEESGTIRVEEHWPALPQPGDTVMLIPDRGVIDGQVTVACRDERPGGGLLRLTVTAAYRQQREVHKLSLVTAKLVETE